MRISRTSSHRVSDNKSHWEGELEKAPLFFWVAPYNSDMFDSKALNEKLKKIAQDNQATKDVEAFGLKLKLRLLTSDEDMEVFDGLEGLQGASYFMTMKKDVLARAVYMIDGQELPDEVEAPDGKKLQRRIYLKQYLFKEMPQMALDQLHAAYLVLNVEFKTTLDEQVKFDNADLINKYLEEEQASAVASKTVDSLIQQELDEQEAAKPAPKAQPPVEAQPAAEAPKPSMTSFARPGPKA
jgi:hypothetical protein